MQSSDPRNRLSQSAHRDSGYIFLLPTFDALQTYIFDEIVKDITLSATFDDPSVQGSGVGSTWPVRILTRLYVASHDNRAQQSFKSERLLVPEVFRFRKIVYL